MGRRRKQDTHLPKRMYMRRGAYYFCHPETNEWQPLGKDIAAAFAAYGKLDAVNGAATTWATFDRIRTEVLPLKRSAKTPVRSGEEARKPKAAYRDMPTTRSPRSIATLAAAPSPVACRRSTLGRRSRRQVLGAVGAVPVLSADRWRALDGKTGSIIRSLSAEVRH